MAKDILFFFNSLDNISKSINPPSVQWQLGTETIAVSLLIEFIIEEVQLSSEGL